MTDMRSELMTIAIEYLQRGQFQPRQHFDQGLLDELAQSIRNSGLLQPLVVRRLGPERYEIIAGERRWRAAQLAGLTEIPVLVGNFSDEQALEAAIIENVNRSDLNPIEEAKGYKRLMDEFSYIQDEIAKIVGKSRVAITNTLRLLNLDERVQTLLIEGQLSEGHGKAIASLDPDLQFTFANKAVKHAWSVRTMEKNVKQALQPQSLSEQVKQADIRYLETKLTEQLGCQTQVDFSSGSGSLKINFHNLDILQGVLKKMGYKTDD